MSFLHDVLSFEGFNLKDILGKLKKDPLRIPLGALDPFSTRVWDSILGKHWEPAVDQFGGAYGGKAVTLGDTGEGVYGRARAAGVPTGPGSQMHDLAHLITSLFAGNYGMSKLPIPQQWSQYMNRMPSGGGFGNLLQPQEPPPEVTPMFQPIDPSKSPEEIQYLLSRLGTVGAPSYA